MKKTDYNEVKGESKSYLGLLAVLFALVGAGLLSALYMEHNGHIVTGMTNQIVWGLPHVFAVFLIVAASGALNVSSIGTVFGKRPYKPLGRLSNVMAIALLIGGLVVLVLDLGHPDRLIVAMTSYNFKSIFAWNIFLYVGFIGVTAIYLWFMMDRKMNPHYTKAGKLAFVWRLILTTGTGSIFGFLVAREAYDAALMAPMFIVDSFAYGLAIFLVVLLVGFKQTQRPIGDIVPSRLKGLLSVFILASFYFTAIYHLENLYRTANHDLEYFLLLDGNYPYKSFFWVGQFAIGTVLPLMLLWAPAFKKSLAAAVTACTGVVLGGLSHMYVVIIGGQAFPMDLFPGQTVTSSFYDGVVASYHPSLPEFLLGLGGFAFAILIVSLGVKILKLMPLDLSDDYVS
ncbi:MAG: NrfD/PsrC family molybdoenzyme membrane anchor subunit [bacterium]